MTTRRFPFRVPRDLTEQLGYERVVSQSFAAPLPTYDLPLDEAVLRSLGFETIDGDRHVTAVVAKPTGPRRLLALYWEPGGDELAWDDGVRSGAGQLNHWPWIDWLDRIAADVWLEWAGACLGGSDRDATHRLIVDRQTWAAYVAPVTEARMIVATQALPEVTY